MKKTVLGVFLVIIAVFMPISILASEDKDSNSKEYEWLCEAGKSIGVKLEDSKLYNTQDNSLVLWGYDSSLEFSVSDDGVIEKTEFHFHGKYDVLDDILNHITDVLGEPDTEKKTGANYKCEWNDALGYRYSLSKGGNYLILVVESNTTNTPVQEPLKEESSLESNYAPDLLTEKIITPTELQISNVDFNYTDPEIVEAVQIFLANHGYDVGTPDGIAGEMTQSAITQFQAEYDMKETGTITVQLLYFISEQLTDDDLTDTMEAIQYYNYGNFDAAIDKLQALGDTEFTRKYISNCEIMKRYQGVYQVGINSVFNPRSADKWYILDGWNYVFLEESRDQESCSRTQLIQQDGEYKLVGTQKTLTTRELKQESGEMTDVEAMVTKYDTGKESVSFKNTSLTTEGIVNAYLEEGERLEKESQEMVDKWLEDLSSKKAPAIGMTKEEVLESTWGKPERVNETITKNMTYEQWVYSGYRYLYFEDGVLTTIQQ